MTFARIIYSRSLDLIGQRIDAGQASPTDEEIARHCGLDEAASVRSLLADLADRGDITIRGTGGDRVILLGRQRAGFTAPARPIRAVRKPLPSDDAVIEAGLAKIKAALARGKAAVGPASRNTPEASGTARKAPSGTVLAVPSRASGSASPIEPPADRLVRDTVDAGAQREVSAAPAAPHPVMAELAQIPPEVVAELSQPKLEMVRMPTTQRAVRGRPAVAEPARQSSKQVNVNLSAEQFALLDGMATEHDLQTSSMARALLTGALDRPRIPARVATAAMRAGVPVLEFAAMLMELGLAEHRRSPAAQEHA